MLSRLSVQFRLVALLCMLGCQGAAIGQTYDLANDFAITPNGVNGTWAYGYAVPIFNQVFPYDHTWDAASIGGFNFSQIAYTGGYPNSFFRNAGGFQFDIPRGDVGGHSFNDSGVVVLVQWTAPIDCTVNVAGAAWMTHDVGRDNMISLDYTQQGILNHVFSNVPLPARSQGVNSATPFALVDACQAVGTPPGILQGLTLRAGDTIRFYWGKTPLSPFGDFMGVRLRINVSGDNRVGTYVSATPQTVRRGRNATTYSFLKRSDTNARLMGENLTLLVDGVQVAATTMGSIAQFDWTVPVGLASGNHTLTIRYGGNAQFKPSQASAVLTVQ